jgi:hypothetical protein
MSKSSEINAKDWYTGNVFNKLYNSGFNKRILKQSHKLLEKNRKNSSYPITLELGATKGYHFQFIEHDFKKYIISDLYLTNDLIELGKRNSNLEVKQLDANNLNCFNSQEIDRIVTTCLLQHLPDADKVINSIIEKLKIQTGVFDTLLSNTETVLWQIGRLFLIAPKLVFTKFSLKSYFAFYRSDHVNSCEQILKIFSEIKNVQMEVSKFPANFLPNFLTLYYRVSVKKLS